MSERIFEGWSKRRISLERVMRFVNIVDGDDKDRLIGEMMKELLFTDPMTIQEAGVVARALRDALFAGERFSRDEYMEIYAGGYEKAELIFRTNEVRRKAWVESFKVRDDSEDEIYLFREMGLDIGQVTRIRTNGLVAAGVEKFGMIEEVLARQTTGGISDYGLANWQICKGNVLRETWAINEHGSSPFKLGISFTTLENLANPKRTFFGEWLVVVKLRRNEVVKENSLVFDEREDERTAFFGVSKEAIVGVYDMRGRKRNEIYERARRIVNVDKIRRSVLKRFSKVK